MAPKRVQLPAVPSAALIRHPTKPRVLPGKTAYMNFLRYFRRANPWMSPVQHVVRGAAAWRRMNFFEKNQFRSPSIMTIIDCGKNATPAARTRKTARKMCRNDNLMETDDESCEAEQASGSSTFNWKVWQGFLNKKNHSGFLRYTHKGWVRKGNPSNFSKTCGMGEMRINLKTCVVFSCKFRN